MENTKRPAIYLAGRYSRQLELLAHAEELRAAGFRVTSRWLNGSHEMKDEALSADDARRFADEDLSDVLAADILIAFTESPGAKQGRARGGRHVEFGYALAANLCVWVVGHRENVFCHLKCVKHFDDWPAARAALLL